MLKEEGSRVLGLRKEEGRATGSIGVSVLLVCFFLGEGKGEGEGIVHHNVDALKMAVDIRTSVTRLRQV